MGSQEHDGRILAKEGGRLVLIQLLSSEKADCLESSTVFLTGESRVFLIDSAAGNLPNVGLGPL